MGVTITKVNATFCRFAGFLKISNVLFSVSVTSQNAIVSTTSAKLISSVVNISDITIDKISPLDESDSPLISIVNGIVLLDHLTIRDISNGFSSIISAS
jgi:hypothetical protein